MKASMKDQAAGKFHEAKGTIKEIAGRISDKPELVAEGNAEKMTGKAQYKIGQIKKVIGK